MRDMQIIVTISSDGTRTVAVAEANAYGGVGPDGESVFSGVGSAGRERGDKDDQIVGDNLATARALRSLAAHLEKCANGKVRHAESIKAHKAEIAERNAGALSDALQLMGHLKPPHDF